MTSIKSTFRLLTIMALASLTLFSCSCNDDDDDDITVVSLQVSSSETFTLHTGTKTQFHAYAIFSNGSNREVTNEATWTSSDVAISTVNSAGLVNAVSVGNTIITVSFSGINSSADITVIDVPITHLQIYSSDGLALHTGTNSQFQAFVIYSDGSNHDVSNEATWTSSNSAVSSVNETGLVSAISAGIATISTSFSGFSANAETFIVDTQPVVIFISRDDTHLYVGVTAQLTATGVYADGSSQNITTDVTWISDNTAIASVENDIGEAGIVTGVSAGNTNVTASLGNISGTTNIEVLPATLVSIYINAKNTSINKGLHEQLIAIGIYSDNTETDITEDVVWSTSNESIATISNITGSKGLLFGKNTGNVTVTAQFNDISATVGFTVLNAIIQTITITGSTNTVQRNSSLQLTATGHFSDGTEQDITYSSSWITSDNSIAGVNQTGLVTGYAVGSAIITAQVSNVTSTFDITVTEALNVTSVATTAEFRVALQLASTNGINDKILLSDGIFNVNDDSLGTFRYISDTGNELIIEGTHTNNTIVDGNSSNRVFFIEDDQRDSSLSLLNITVQNGHSIFNGETPDANGGGASINARSITIEGCDFNNNYSGNDGGGAYLKVTSLGVISIVNTIFNLNKAELSSAISMIISQLGFNMESVVITNNTSKYRTVTVSGSSSSTSKIHQMYFANNSYLLGGTGRAMFSVFSATINLSNSSFVNNRSLDLGVLDASGNEDSIVTNTIFDNNVSVNQSVSPPRLASIRGAVVNSLFINNSHGPIISSGTDFTTRIVNTAFVSNALTTRDTVLESCFVDLNRVTGTYAESNTVFSETPNFKDEANGDYRLTDSSIMVDAGISTHPSVEIPTTDLDGVSRPIGASTDIGPYEFDPNNP